MAELFVRCPGCDRVVEVSKHPFCLRCGNRCLACGLRQESGSTNCECGYPNDETMAKLSSRIVPPSEVEVALQADRNRDNIRDHSIIVISGASSLAIGVMRGSLLAVLVTGIVIFVFGELAIAWWARWKAERQRKESLTNIRQR